MKVGLIGNQISSGQKVVNDLLSDSKFELVYLNLSSFDTTDYYDLEYYCDDVEILFTMFDQVEKNEFYINKYGDKVKVLI